VPVVAVSGHRQIAGATNIVLDHASAARNALRHLAEQGHRQIAFLKGQAFSSDTEPRWRAIREATRQLGLPFRTELTAQLTGESSSPELGYEATRRLIAAGVKFTAIFAFNDVSAIGAIRALRERGYKVPEDVSVVGFDVSKARHFTTPD